MLPRVYMDHNASTPLDPRVRAEMVDSLDDFGNPSSIHEEGRAARDRVETARRRVAGAIGADPAEVIFCSGGTEADVLGLVGLYRAARRAGRPPRVLVPAIEHPAVLGTARHLEEEGAELLHLPVCRAGRADLEAAAEACRRGAAVLAVALANHELGTLQEVEALAAVAREAGVFLHCDAVQALGKVPVEVTRLGADTVALSSHKIYGPKGAGALFAREGLDLPPLYGAGHQERERRPGTEGVLAAVGFGAAAELAATDGLESADRVGQLAAQLEAGLARIEGARIHGAGAPRVPGTVNAGFAGARGDVIVQALDLEGIAASTGAACTSGTVAPSPVLLAIGLSKERAAEGVRFSLGRTTRAEEVQAVLEVLPGIVERARKFSR